MSLDLFNKAFADATVRSYMICVIGVLVAFILLFLVRYLIRGAARHRVNSIHDGPAMSMMDIDTMRKRGLVSSDEYKAIRHALATREVDKERRRQQADRERLILAQIEHDPDAARQLLPPEVLAAATARDKPESTSQAPESQTAPASPAPAPSIQAASQRPVASAPPASAPAQPATAAPNAPANAPKDLDALLEKGAITLEEYDALRAFFQ